MCALCLAQDIVRAFSLLLSRYLIAVVQSVVAGRTPIYIYLMPVHYTYESPLRDVFNLKSRGCRKLEREREHRRSYVYEP